MTNPVEPPKAAPVKAKAPTGLVNFFSVLCLILVVYLYGNGVDPAKAAAAGAILIIVHGFVLVLVSAAASVDWNKME